MSVNRYISRNGGQLTDTVPATASSGISSAGQIVALNASGLLDSTMLPSSSGGTPGSYVDFRASGFASAVGATVVLGGSGYNSQYNPTLQYRVFNSACTVKQVEYSFLAGATSTITLQLYNLTKAAVVTGTATTITVGTAASAPYLMTGFSATISAGDHVQVQLVQATGQTAVTLSPFNASLYIA